MKKIAVCVSVFLLLGTGFAQTDTKPVAPSKDEQVKPNPQPQVSSGDAKTRTSTEKPTKNIPKATDSPYVDGRVQMGEEGFLFGYTPANCTIFHSFFIKNVGTDTLDIVKVRPG